jgi:hypothetical protein
MATMTKIYDLFGEPLELTIEYRFIRGYRASGPSYFSGGEPGEPDQCEIETVSACRQKEVRTYMRNAEGILIPGTRTTTYKPAGKPFAITGDMLGLIQCSEEIHQDLLDDAEDISGHRQAAE